MIIFSSSYFIGRQLRGDWEGHWTILLNEYRDLPFYINDVTGEVSDGMGKSIVAGQRLLEVLPYLRDRKEWPVPASEGTDFELEVKKNRRATKIDLSQDGYVQVVKALNIDDLRSEDPTHRLAQKSITIGTYDVNFQWERIPNERGYFITGRVENPVRNIVDGDTIYDIKVETVGGKVRGIRPGDTIKAGLRLVGIQTPEIKKENQRAEDVQANNRFAKKYGINPEETWRVAEEARQIVRSIFWQEGGSILIDLDVDADGDPTTTHGRYIGMVYKLPTQEVHELPEDGMVLNINKTLVATRWSGSKTIPVPLAMPWPTSDESKTRFHEAMLWENSLTPGREIRQKEIEREEAERRRQYEEVIAEERARLRYNNEATTTVEKTHITTSTTTLEGLAKYYNTSTDLIVQRNGGDEEEVRRRISIPGTTIIVPVIEIVGEVVDPTYDFLHRSSDGYDNTLGFFDPMDDRREMETDFHLRIGDVQLVIPPVSINVDRTSSLEKIKALRTKSSIITKTSSSTTTLTLQLYFSDLDSINGYAVKIGTHQEEITDPNVPEDIKQRYKKTIEDIYYMDGLRSLIAQFKKAPFLPVQNEYINDVLGIHAVALANLSVSTVPGFPHSISATLTLAKFEIDAYMPTEVSLDECINYPMFRWYYQEAMNPKYADNPYRTYLHPIEGPLTNEFYFEIADEEQLKERQEAIKELRFMDSPALYKNKISKGETEYSRFYVDYQRLLNALEQQRIYQGLKSSMGSQFPELIHQGDEIYHKIYGPEGPDPDGHFIPKEQAHYHPEWPDSGVYIIRIDSTSNKNRIPSRYYEGAGIYRIAANPNSEAVEIIKEHGEAIALEVDTYALRYSKIKEKAIQSEGFLKMNPYRISDMWMTSIQVLYENSFVPIQLQNLDNPTLQYLGSQDPYIQVTFETTSRESIDSLRHLLEESERYARDYRYGITSGFIGFQNQLTRLFGITTVMPENVRISTVPGFANRFQIQMILCGFNKTQKRSETLEGQMGTFMDSKLEDRHLDKDPVENDAIVLERKMHDLEVYPDLELPTVAELNKVLQRINAGIKVYSNPRGSKYVDPDFYVSTKWTMRKYVLEEREKNHTLTMKDLSGLEGKMAVTAKPKVEHHATHDEEYVDYENTSWLDDEYFIPHPDSDFDFVIDTIDAYTSAIKVSQTGSYSAPNQVSPTGRTGDIAEYYEKFAEVQDMKSFIKDPDNLRKRPTMEEWTRWQFKHVPLSQAYTVVRMYEKFYEELDNPSHLDIYKEIYKWIDKYFVENGYAVREEDMRTNLDIYKELTYASVEDYYRASMEYIAEVNPQFVHYQLTNNLPTSIKSGDFRKLSQATGQQGVPKITRERIANYIKALFHQQSFWMQYEEDGSGKVVPRLSSDRVGIGALPLNSHAQNIDMARRLAWDWKYNIEYSIKHFFDLYLNALGSKDINIRCRPWDWAVRAYHSGDFFSHPNENYRGRLSTPEYSYFMSIFEGTIDDSTQNNALYNHEDAYAFTPGNIANTEVLYEYHGITPGKGEGLSGVLKNMGMSLAMRMLNQGFSQPVTQQEREMYQMAVAKATGDLSKIEQDLVERQSRRLLVFNEDPRRLHRDMFHDMVEYDQRGRLIRAFPTFQMFIIDEGRWMTSYKLWDNLYGFNSIQSIDIHRSRKIAADTAIIRMTNVYSNLTSRTLDENYGDWTYSFWDNLFWGRPDESIIDARKELADSMMLKTGARIHLRLGYSADAAELPVVFNGTITELDAQEVVTIIAQSDGLELTNVISADPKEQTKDAFGFIQEPREVLCKLMTSRGNWFKDWMNQITDGRLWGDTHPLGILHFGNPVKAPPALNPFKIFKWYNEPGTRDDYGEAAQNIYSSNGQNTFSQWTYKDGSSIGWTWKGTALPIPWPKGDEQNTLLKLEGQTTWDIAQTLALITPDYIAAVHPFELRSTLFFGKPYYRLAYRYDSAYKWNRETRNWERTVTSEVRKPYMQYHVFNGITDIVSNKIKASEEGVYTNVIAVYEKGESDLQMADWDIRIDKQKTATVQAPIVAQWGRDFWTSKNQANYYARSVLRDYMKDMYKGQLIILGDPTVKPYDMCYMNDTINDMNGPFLVKEVAHHFSYETGFITSVSPDAICIVDDKVMLSHASWFASFAKGLITHVAGGAAAAIALRKLVGNTLFLRGKDAALHTVRALTKLSTYLPSGEETIDQFKETLREYMDVLNEERKLKRGKLPEIKDRIGHQEVLDKKKKDILEKLDKSHKAVQDKIGDLDPKNMKGRLGKANARMLLWTTDKIHLGVKSGKTKVQSLRLMATATLRTFVVGAIASAALMVVTETLTEMFKRKKTSLQAVTLLPLMYQGRQFTAGINGHKGMVVGDDPGKWDKFFMGMGEYGGIGGALNWMFDNPSGSFGKDAFSGSVSFTTTYEEINSGQFESEGGFRP